MTQLTDQEEQQVELSVNYIMDVVMPALDHFEDVLSLMVDDGEFMGCPHFDAMVCCVRALVERGWTADELTEQVRHHAEDQESDKVKRVVN